MEASLSCECGKLKGRLARVTPNSVNRILCYCDDCQAFAHYLVNADAILDPRGGSDISQMAPDHVQITEGREHMACMLMSEKGIYRWYAACCNTPIGNTGGYGMPFLGMVHAMVIPQEQSDSLFGPVKGAVQTKYAKPVGEANDEDDKGFPLSTLFRFAKIILGAKLSGAQKRSPFFDSETKAPSVAPTVLTPEERQALLSRI